jgi:hypothetical protein
MKSSVRLRGALFAIVGLVLAARDGRCDPAQEEIDSTRQSIIQGIRDDIQRKLKNPNSETTSEREPEPAPRIRHHYLKKSPPK